MDTPDVELNFQRVWQMFAETRKQIEETNARVGDLTGKWGKFVEGLVAPAAIRLFAERGISVNQTFQRAKSKMDGANVEVDVLAVNDKYAVLIEVKSTLGIDDVKDHLKRLGKFKIFFPQYADRKVIGAVAGIVIDEGADLFAYKHGLFVIAQSGEMVTILNNEQFHPTVW